MSDYAIANLYDSGWRFTDYEMLAEEYHLSPAEVDEICDKLYKLEME